MITEPAHELVFGDLLLTGDLQVTDYTFQVVGEDADLGSPEPVEQTIATLLQDGAQVVTRSHGNREVTFRITIEAGDAVALAEGEKALFLECSRPNLLSWTPPDGYGAASVFEVFTSSLEPAFDDLDELYLRRTYRLRLVCHPFTRSVDLVVTPALADPPVSPTVVVISDGSSATGWSSPDSPLLSAAGVLRVPGHRTGPPVVLPGGTVDQYPAVAEATYTASPIDFSTTPYLTVEVTPASAQIQFGANVPTVYADGVVLDVVKIEAITGSGKRVIYRVEDPSVTTLRIVQVVTQTVIPHGATPVGVPTVLFDNISRTDLDPGISTTGQSSARRVTVEGSARTQGSLAVSHETGGLGEVILYTSPVLLDDYQPELMRYHVGGGRTSDADAVITGSYSDTLDASVPIGALPAGGYVLVARMRSSVGGGEVVSVSWSAETVIGSAVVATSTSDAVAVSLVEDVFHNFMLGGLVLPPGSVPGESLGEVHIVLDMDAVSVSGVIDEVWAFYVGDDAALTMVSCGAGTLDPGVIHNRLWVNSPTVAEPRPTVYVGTEDDQSDAFHAGSLASAWGLHSFPPGPMLVYIANDGEPNPAMSLSHFPRWFTHAGF